MGGAVLAMAASAGVPGLGLPDEDALVSALSLVDRVAWAASDRQIDALLRTVGHPDGTFASSVRDPADPPPWSTFYAVEADLVEGAPFAGRELGVTVREAIVWRNPTREPLWQLTLRVFGDGQDANPDGARIRGVWVDNRRAETRLDGTLLRIDLPRPVAPGARIRVLLQLDERVPGFVPRRPVHDAALSLEETGIFGQAEGCVNLGWFLPVVTPVDASGRFEGRPLRANTEHAMFEPAAFHVVLDVPDAYEVASTGVEVARRSEGGRSTVVAVASGSRDFAAMLVRNGSVAEREVDGVRLRVVHPADEPQMGADLLGYAEGMVKSYTRQFGPMDGRELDIVETPIRGLTSIDFPGLVAIDTSHQGYPYHRNAAHEWTLAHEIAHQWWAVDVGSDPALAPWLDEGLSSWAAALYWSGRYGEDAVEARYELEVAQRLVELRDRGVEDLPADLPAWKYDLDQFAAIVQGRGSLYFEQVRATLGDQALFLALQGYHRQFRGRFATADDLLAALTAATPDPAVQAELAALYQRWIREAHSYEDLVP